MSSRLVTIYPNSYFHLLIIIMLLLSFCSAVTGENNSSELKGEVEYWDHQPASGIELLLLFSNATIANSTMTNISGYYLFSNLSSENYSLLVKFNDSIVHIYNFTIGPDACLWHNITFKDSDGDGVPDSGKDPGDDDGEDDDDINGDDDNDDTEPVSPTEKEENADETTTRINLIVWIVLVILVIIILSLAIFSRIRRSNVLKHETRDRICTHINENPGEHFNAIKDELGLSTGVLSYHIERLEKEKFISSRMEGKFKRFYPPFWDKPPEVHLSEVQEILLEQIKRRPGISQSDLGNRIGRNRKVVNYQAHQLRELGFIDIEKDGRESKCYFVKDV